MEGICGAELPAPAPKLAAQLADSSRTPRPQCPCLRVLVRPGPWAQIRAREKQPSPPALGNPIQDVLDLSSGSFLACKLSPWEMGPSSALPVGQAPRRAARSPRAAGKGWEKPSTDRRQGCLIWDQITKTKGLLAAVYPFTAFAFPPTNPPQRRSLCGGAVIY